MRKGNPISVRYLFLSPVKKSIFNMCIAFLYSFFLSWAINIAPCEVSQLVNLCVDFFLRYHYLFFAGGEGAFTGGEGSPFGFICYNRVGGLDRALALPSESESSDSADSEAAFQAYLANTIETATPEGILFSQIRLLENGGFYNLPPQNAPGEYASLVRLHLSQAINQNHFWEILSRENFELSVLQRRGLIETKLYQLMDSEPQLARILEYALSQNIRKEADSFIQERLAPVLDQRTPTERMVLDNQLNSFIHDLRRNGRTSAIYRNFYRYFTDEDFRRRFGLPLP